MAPKGGPGGRQQSEEDLLLQDFSRNLSAKSSALFFGNAFIVSAIPICKRRERAGGRRASGPPSGGGVRGSAGGIGALPVGEGAPSGALPPPRAPSVQPGPGPRWRRGSPGPWWGWRGLAARCCVAALSAHSTLWFCP